MALSGIHWDPLGYVDLIVFRIQSLGKLFKVNAFQWKDAWVQNFIRQILR